MTTRLTEIGVDTTAGTEAYPATARETVVLTSEQQQELQSALDSVSDADVKYDTCVQKLTEFGFCSQHT